MDRRGEGPIDCPFCDPDRDVLIETEFALAVLDGYPVAEGHTLVLNQA